MASHPAHFAEYYRILFKIQIIRSVQLLASSYARWSGRVPVSNIRPFETIYVPSTKSTRRITVNVYPTKGAIGYNVGPVAVHLNWHSSGFVLNTFGESVPFVAHLLSHPLLEQYPLVFLDCDYAKAPENPCPAPTDDARDVLDYVFARPEQFDLNRVTLGGFSTGGCMALGLSATVGKEAREGNLLGKQPSNSGHPIKAVIAFYPPTERESRPDVHPPAGVTVPGVSAPKAFAEVFLAAYFYPPRPLTEEEAAQKKEECLQSPLLTPRWADPRDFPACVGLVTCEYDTLTLEAENLRAELMKAEYKKQVKGWMVKGVGHAWDIIVLPGQAGFEDRQKAYDLAAQIIAEAGGVSIGE